MLGIKEDAAQLRLSSSLPRVAYSCGSCGYQLNLNADNRNTSVICSKYSKMIKRGIITFFCIDESRFDQVEKLRWVPFFSSKSSWGFFQPRTKLLCRKCGNHIGSSYTKSSTSSWPKTVGKSHSIAWDGITSCHVYEIKIRALQPSYTDGLSFS